MHARISTSAAALLIVLSIAFTACEDRSALLHYGSSLRPTPFESRRLSVQPAALTPEFLHDPACRALPPFRTRFDLFLHTDRNLLLNRVRFVFHDPAAGRSMPVPIPVSPAVPVPGELPFHGARVSPPFTSFGLFLNFGCGIPARGTLFIDVDTVDDDGVAGVARTTVPIG